MVYGFWDLVILFFKKTKSSSQELNEEKLRKERPRVKLVLRSKIVMSPGFSNPKWSNWCTFYPFLTPNMTVKSQKWLKWNRIQRHLENWSTYLWKLNNFCQNGTLLKKSVRFGMFFCFVAIWWAVIHIYSLSSWPVTRTNNQSAFDLANFISDLTTLEKMQSTFDQSKVIWNDS